MYRMCKFFSFHTSKRQGRIWDKKRWDIVTILKTLLHEALWLQLATQYLESQSIVYQYQNNCRKTHSKASAPCVIYIAIVWATVISLATIGCSTSNNNTRTLFYIRKLLKYRVKSMFDYCHYCNHLKIQSISKSFEGVIDIYFYRQINLIEFAQMKGFVFQAFCRSLISAHMRLSKAM